MVLHQMAEADALFFRDDGHEVGFDLVGVGLLREAEALGQALSARGLPQGDVQRYVDVTRESVFYSDPHLCMKCRYRSTELLWQCPHCHEWNTFVEERITPATDTEAEIPTVEAS